MLKIRRIISYYHEKQLSKRSIAKALSISRDVVSDYLCDFRQKGLSYQEFKKMSDEEVLELFERRHGRASLPETAATEKRPAKRGRAFL